jgi:hypothetical protein
MAYSKERLRTWHLPQNPAPVRSGVAATLLTAVAIAAFLPLAGIAADPPAAPPVPVPGSPAQIAAALAASQASLRAAGDDRPGLFSEAPSADDRHAPAAVVTAVAAESPAQLGGLLPGDQVLMIDGFRMHDLVEIHLYQDLLPVDRDSERWTVVRGEATIEVVVSGLDASASVGVGADPDPHAGDAGKLLAKAGVAVIERDQVALQELPGRALHALQDWLEANKAQSGPPPPWLRTFAVVASKVLRGDDELPVAVAIPVPLLARLDGFYRAIAVMRRTNGALPDLRAWGMDRFSLALWFPYAQDQFLPRMFRRLAVRDRGLRELMAANKGPGATLSRMLRSHPSQVAAALVADLDDGRIEEEVHDLCDQLNDLAWAFATDQRLLDAQQAQLVAQEMVHLRGRFMNAAQKDTVAAAFARAGDFPKALRWQQAAVRECAEDERAGFRSRLELYQAGKPLLDHQASLRPVSHAYADGSIRLEGFMDGEHRAGRWRAHHPSGTLVADGTLLDDLPYGHWTTFTATGAKSGEGWVVHGHRIGPWRIFAPDGTLGASGSFLVVDGVEVRSGRWQWFYVGGQVREQGSFVDGRRAGVWTAYGPDGQVIGSDRFAAGHPSNPGWPGLGVPELLDAPALEPPQVGDNSF